MTNKQNNIVGQIIPGIVGFIIGAVFGLVILGWWLWPVTWKDATPAVLSASSRQDYLRAAIDSYMLNQDADIARQRYEVLGEHGASTLAAIYSNPLNQTAEAVQAYAAAVGATAVLQNPPGVPTAAVVNTPAPGVTPGAATTRPASTGGLAGWLWRGLLACLALLLVMGIFFFFFNRSRKRTRSRPAGKTGVDQLEEPAAGMLTGQVPTGGTYQAPVEVEERSTVRLAEAAEAAAATESEEALAPGELPDWLQGAPTIPVEPEVASTPAAVAAEIPDWLQEAAPPPAAPERVEEELPDWLQEAATQAPIQPAPAQPAPAATPGFIEEPEWLAEAASAPPAAPLTWEPDETKEQTHAKFSQNLENLPAMDPEFARRLRTAGVGVPLLLLKKGATAAARQDLARRAGIDPAELTTWVNVVDLYRVRGLTAEHALLMDGVGIHGVPELATADPDQLAQAMAVTNQEYNLLERTPDRTVIANWIEQAQKLPKAVA